MFSPIWWRSLPPQWFSKSSLDGGRVCLTASPLMIPYTNQKEKCYIDTLLISTLWYEFSNDFDVQRDFGKKKFTKIYSLGPFVSFKVYFKKLWINPFNVKNDVCEPPTIWLGGHWDEIQISKIEIRFHQPFQTVLSKSNTFNISESYISKLLSKSYNIPSSILQNVSQIFQSIK